MDSTFAWIFDEIRRERFEEISELAFEWEVNHTAEYFYWCYGDLGYEIRWPGMDDSAGMFYGDDYFIERDEVH